MASETDLWAELLGQVVQELDTLLSGVPASGWAHDAG
jgi:hypothetical protein